MQTYTSQAYLSNTTDERFRLWGKAVSDGLTAVGLVRKADTGQINWTSVTAPSTTNQRRGYEIWEVQDVFAATFPMYLKIEYGSGASTWRPQIWVSVGTGSNGSGTLTIPAAWGTIPEIELATGGATEYFSSNGTSSNLYDIYVSGSGSNLAVAVFNYGSGVNRNRPLFFAFDRERDIDGQPEGNYVTIWGQNTQVTISKTYGVLGAESVILSNGIGNMWNTPQFDGKNPVSEIKPYWAGFHNPTTTIVAMHDIGAATPQGREFDAWLNGKEFKWKTVHGVDGVGTDLIGIRWA